MNIYHRQRGINGACRGSAVSGIYTQDQFNCFLHHIEDDEIKSDGGVKML